MCSEDNKLPGDSLSSGLLNSSPYSSEGNGASVSEAKSFPCESKNTVGLGSHRFQSTQGHPCDVELHWKRDEEISPTCLYSLSNNLLVSGDNSSIISQHSLMNGGETFKILVEGISLTLLPCPACLSLRKLNTNEGGLVKNNFSISRSL